MGKGGKRPGAPRGGYKTPLVTEARLAEVLNEHVVLKRDFVELMYRWHYYQRWYRRLGRWVRNLLRRVNKSQGSYGANTPVGLPAAGE